MIQRYSFCNANDIPKPNSKHYFVDSKLFIVIISLYENKHKENHTFSSCQQVPGVFFFMIRKFFNNEIKHCVCIIGAYMLYMQCDIFT